MDLSRQSISGLFLRIVAWIQIGHTAFTILGTFTMKIYSATNVQKDISMAKGKLVDLQFHLKGLGLTWVDIDVDVVEKIIHSLIWFIFVLGMIWILLNLFMATHLLRGVQNGDVKILKRWILFGLFVLTLDILFYPLQVVVCAQAKDVIGPLCDPSNNVWLDVILTLIFYSSVWVAYLHRKDMLDQSKERTRRERKVRMSATATATTNGKGGDDSSSAHVNELIDLDLDLDLKNKIEPDTTNGIQQDVGRQIATAD